MILLSSGELPENRAVQAGEHNRVEKWPFADHSRQAGRKVIGKRSHFYAVFRNGSVHCEMVGFEEIAH